MARKNNEGRLLILDRAELAQGHLRAAHSEVWKQRYHAKRFVFDREASYRIGEMLHRHLDLLVDNIEFARTPFPTCYFELDTRSMWAGWRPDIAVDPTGDAKVGFLVHNGLVMILANGPLYRTDGAGGSINVLARDAVCGMSFRINRPQSVPYAKLTGLAPDLAETAKISYVFGGVRLNRENELATFTHNTKVLLPEPEKPGLWTHEQIAAHFDIIPSYADTTGREVVSLSFLGGGDPMLLTTMLLLLNQPSKHVALEHVPRDAGLWRGKRWVFKEHHVVKLKLDRAVAVAKLFSITDRKSPIAHEVMGHWKHYNKHPTCSHHHDDGRQAWEPVGMERSISGDYKRYWCPLCLQRRTWTEDFHTGSGGAATTEYTVTR